MKSESEEDIKYLPAGPLEGQVQIHSYPHFHQGPFQNTDDRQEMKATTEEGDPLYLSLPNASDSEFVTPGVNNYRALMKLFRPESKERGWEPDREEYESLDELPSPTREEMGSLRQKYKEQLEKAETDDEEREVLKEMWEEAADMELEGQVPIGLDEETYLSD